jgi:hypothetical protein
MPMRRARPLSRGRESEEVFEPMSDTELLEAGLDTLFATFAVGALLFPLTLISATALAYLRNSVGEGWGPRWEAGAAFRVSVLVALWVPVVGLLTGYEWWNSDVLRGYGILILVAIATRAFVRAVWQASRDSLAELSGRVRGSLASRDPEIDDRASLRKHKERLEAKVRWLEHEDLGISDRMGLFARLKDRRIERALRRTEAELQRVDARLARLEDDPWQSPLAVGRSVHDRR